MSWHFSLALEAEFCRGRSLDGELSVLWRSIPFAPGDSCSAKMKDTCHRSPYGMMFVLSTARHGAELLMWFQGGFLASRSVKPLTENEQPLIFGPRCEESLKRLNRDSSLQKTCAERQSTKLRPTAENLGMKLRRSVFPRKTWVLTTFGADIGYLHTPTCAANYTAKSMQKHLGCQNFVRVFGKPTPTNHEWMMGWPIGWTASVPLETDKFLSWQRQHGEF